MADESRWRDEDRYGLDDMERNRWNAWRDERDHGRYVRGAGRDAREFGNSWGGYRNESPYGGLRGGSGRDDWRDDAVRESYGTFAYGRDYGAPYRGPGYGYAGRGQSRYGSNGGQGRFEDRDRGWFDRASDEVSSWFGDEEAERRREMDAADQGRRGRGPKGYVRSDERIREDVCDRLSDDAIVDASEVDVSVSGSEVTLSGSVASREERRRAEECVERVSGVTHVQNNLRVIRTGSTPGVGTTGTGARPTGTGRNETSPSGRGAAH